MMRRRTQGSQAGVTLVEMLVVLVILSIAILTFAVGLQTSQTATTDASARQKMHVALGAFRTALQTHLSDSANWVAPMSGAACQTAGMTSFTATMLNRMQTDPATAGWSSDWETKTHLKFKIVGVRYWVGGPSFPTNATTIVGQFVGCGTAVPDNGLQEYLLEIEQPTTKKNPIRGSIVVRKPYP